MFQNLPCLVSRDEAGWLNHQLFFFALKTNEPSRMPTIRFRNNDVYEGDARDGQPDGTGKLSAQCGIVYQGEFSDGVPHGRGKLTNTRLQLGYNGTWVQGTKTGEGVMSQRGVFLYEGEFFLDAWHGRGTLTMHSPNRARYTGDFSKGDIEGKGTVECSNGDVLVGAFSGGLPHGYGELTLADGSTVRGNFARGILTMQLCGSTSKACHSKEDDTCCKECGRRLHVGQYVDLSDFQIDQNVSKLRKFGAKVGETEKGVAILETTPLSIASTNRLKRGDVILLADGIPVTTTLQLNWLLSRCRPVEIVVGRETTAKIFTVE